MRRSWFDSKRLRVVIAGTALTGALEPFSAARASADAAVAPEGSSGLEEIVVTAQKRVSTVQTTPISITAVCGDDLQARGVSSLASLAQGTPGVSLKSEGPSQTEIEMRGMISSGGNNVYPTTGPVWGSAFAQQQRDGRSSLTAHLPVSGLSTRRSASFYAAAIGANDTNENDAY